MTYITSFRVRKKLEKKIEKNSLKRLKLAKILLALNDLRTEFAAVSEDGMHVCWLFHLRADFVVHQARGASNSFQACRTWNKNQKRIGNFLDVFRQMAQDFLQF